MNRFAYILRSLVRRDAPAPEPYGRGFTCSCNTVPAGELTLSLLADASFQYSSPSYRITLTVYAIR